MQSAIADSYESMGVSSPSLTTVTCLFLRRSAASARFSSSSLEPLSSSSPLYGVKDAACPISTG